MRQIDHRSMKSLSYSKHVQPSLNHLHQDCWEGGHGIGALSPGIIISQRAAFAQFGLDSGATSVLFLLVRFPLFSPVSWLQLPAPPSHVELNKQSCSPRFPTLLKRPPYWFISEAKHISFSFHPETCISLSMSFYGWL